MVYCEYCDIEQAGVPNGLGAISCYSCGMTIGEDYLVEEITFSKGPGGQSRMQGAFDKSFRNESNSLMMSLKRGEDRIGMLIMSLKIDNTIEHSANCFYKMAAQKHFTRRYKIDYVAAACLYLACRAKEKPYLLIDFSEQLAVSVYVLGAVFLQLCQLLLLLEHPIVQKPVDPSLFIRKFTEGLVEKLDEDTEPKRELVNRISDTALRIIASMKRDWMQTGRKPSGLCGAAIYISALANGIRFPKSEIITAVHVSEATLTKRLIEFENTKSGSLTIDEFNSRAEDFEREQRDGCTNKSGRTGVLCMHQDEELHAHGLCKECYDEFFQLSGGLDGDADPPCFQRPTSEEVDLIASRKTNDPNTDRSYIEYNLGNESHDTSAQCNNTMIVVTEKLAEPQSNYNNPVNVKDSEDLTNVEPESENFSDIEDSEVDCYLHTEEETRCKEIIWKQLNKEYLEEEALKNAAKEAANIDMAEATDEIREAHRLAAGVAANIEMLRKKKRQQKAAEAKNAGPARTAAEATINVLNKKRLLKYNADVLQQLFEEDGAKIDSKKSRKDPHDGVGAEGADAIDNINNYDEAAEQEQYGADAIDNINYYSEAAEQDYQEQYDYEPDTHYNDELDNGAYYDGNDDEPYNYGGGNDEEPHNYGDDDY